MIKRLLTLATHRIHSLPVIVLMPHSSCNCRCVMCDIWKGNPNLKQLTVEDVSKLLLSLKKLGTVYLFIGFIKMVKKRLTQE